MRTKSAGCFRLGYLRLLLLVIGMLFLSTAAKAQVVISVGFAPPVLPVYEQPICPGDGYIWTPGYWAWNGDDYFWVPGTWVLAPEVGFFWTPPWWGWGGSAFIFHEGYWGPVVGFYGGIDYGFGYFGHGFVGGRWESGHFFYNRAVTNVNVAVIHNVYETRVENINRNERVSYNGGRGGIDARPTREEEAAEHERHMGPVAAQTQHFDQARANREFQYKANNGRPPVAATSRPGEFNARETNTRNEARNEPSGGHGNSVVHAKDIPQAERGAAPNTGNAKFDQKYQKQQEDLAKKQDQERQKLQQKQDREHVQYQKQQANEARTQQMEQRHAQQTQQLQQRQAAARQQMQQRQAPPSHGGGGGGGGEKSKH